MRPGPCWVAVLSLAGCAASGAPTQLPEQAARVVPMPLVSAPPAPSAPVRGDPWRCTDAISAVRAQAERVSRAYEGLERSADLAAFEREVRNASETSSPMSSDDATLREIVLSYRAALLRQIDEVRGRAAGKVPLPGQGALDEETRVIDRLMDYCGVNREQ